MPRRLPRFFPVSVDRNDDGEVWELTDTFGDRALRVWDEFLSLAEKTQNEIPWSGQQLAAVSRKVRQSSAKVWRSIGWMLAKQWLEVGETLADGSPATLRLRNYAKYHPMKGAVQILSREKAAPSLPSDPSDPSLKKPPTPLAIPDWIPSEPWEAYLRHRKHKRAKVTPEAAEGLIEKLLALKKQGEDITAVLKQSVTNGWTGLFPVSGNSKPIGPDLPHSTTPPFKSTLQESNSQKPDKAEQARVREMIRGLSSKMSLKENG